MPVPLSGKPMPGVLLIHLYVHPAPVKSTGAVRVPFVTAWLFCASALKNKKKRKAIIAITGKKLFMQLVLLHAIQNKSSCVYTVFPEKYIDVFYINAISHHLVIKVTFYLFAIIDAGIINNSF